MPDGTSSAHLYVPKLVTVLREGYRAGQFRKDALAALTVAVVALPLSMAIAVASGVSPERGLYTAIVGGAVVSALSGSRFQIGGPAGAFIVLVSATVQKFGLDGLLLVVLMSGVFLTLLGALRIGSLIRHIPPAVIVGFTWGIALTIFASQIKDLAGITLAGPEPGPLPAKIAALAGAASTLSLAALALGIGTAAVILAVRRLRPSWPGMLIAVVIASLAAAALDLPVETIGTRFGELTGALPRPRWPDISSADLVTLLPSALAFTLLGGIESLLSATVADQMSGRKHRSNMELVGQGIANVASALFGGISVTGTIARTATNIRAGAQTPLSGIMHAAFLLVFLIAAAPLAAYVPLCALAGVVTVVCINMANTGELREHTRHVPEAAAVIATLGFTIIVDLISGIAAGCVVAVLFALGRRLRARP